MTKVKKAVTVFIAAACCQIFSMVKSGFLSHYYIEISLSFLALLAFVFLVSFIFKTNSAAYIASFTSLLLFANLAQLMLFYTCHQENDLIKNNVLQFMLFTVAAIVTAWGFLLILNKVKRAITVCLILFIIVAGGMSVFIFLFSGSGNTSTTEQRTQPAILMMFLMLYAFAGAIAGNHDFWTKILYLGLFWVMMSSLVLRHEFGIPVMTYAACMITYLFFHKNKKKWFFLTNLLIPVLGLIGVFIYNPNLKNDTLNKLSSRIVENEHWIAAKTNLQVAGVLGSEKYDVFLPEASSDYSLNTNVHFWGFLWLGLLLVSFFLMTIHVYRDTMQNSNDNIISNMRKLCYCAMCVIVIYNILDNICGFPIIGMQCICAGTSKSIALLSGLLIGTVLIDPLKTESDLCEFLKERKILIETPDS